MDITIDILKQKKIICDWRTFYVGLKLNLIKYSDLTNYALELLTNHPETSDKDIIQLAWGGDDVDHEGLLANILKSNNINLDFDVIELEERKWRFGVLAYLKMEHQGDYEELLNKVADVYADFNYPEDMEAFVNYLAPTDEIDPLQYSREENVNRLINLFNEFLDKEQYFLNRNHSLYDDLD